MDSTSKSFRQTAVVFDLDHTLTKSDTYLSFLLLVLRNRPSRILQTLLLFIPVLQYKFGFRTNSWLKEEFLHCIVGGASRQQVDDWSAQFVSSFLKTQIRSTALKKILDYRKKGCRLLIASASFDFYVKKLGQNLEFDDVICTRSTWNHSGFLMGQIDGKNCYEHAKLEQLQSYFGTERNQWHIIGYSDHHSDAPLLSWVDQPIAVNPTKKLLEIAKNNGYSIEMW